jgi:hypothetical protein
MSKTLENWLSADSVVFFAPGKAPDKEWDSVGISGTARWAKTTSGVTRLRLFNANGLQYPAPGVRLQFQGQNLVDEDEYDNLPETAYYRAYYWIPQEVQAVGGWWNVMQWKQSKPPEREKYPVYAVCFDWLDGAMRPRLHSNVGRDGEYQGDAPPAAVGEMALAVGKWIEVQTEYRWHRREGRIITWVDGERAWRKDNIQTEFAWPTVPYHRMWAPGHYASHLRPANAMLFVAHCSVSFVPLPSIYPEVEP